MRPILVALLLSITLIGQEPKVELRSRPTQLVKFVELKYLSGDRLTRVVNLARELNAGRASFVYDQELKSFAIRADTPADIAAAEEMIRRFDVPAAESRTRQIQLTVYMLEPSDDEPMPSQRPPADLTAAIDQLRNAFGYKRFRLLETTLMQGRENSPFQTNGILNLGSPASGLAPTYEAKYLATRYDEAQKTLFVNGFSYNVQVPRGSSFAMSSVSTGLTIKDGQKLVIGKVTTDQNQRSGFLVITAKVD